MNRGSVNRLKQNQDMLASLQLLKQDFPDFLGAFKKKEAACLYQIAIFYLLTKNYELFKKYIEDSVIQYSFFSIKQNIFYKFRLAANMLCIIIQLDSVFRSLGRIKVLWLDTRCHELKHRSERADNILDQMKTLKKKKLSKIVKLRRF